MFRDYEQVATFINKLERFTMAVITNHGSPHIEDVSHLNRMRSDLESFVMMVSGISAAGPVEAQKKEYLCPDCNGEMVLRTNRSNGDKFYGCKKYPECKGTRDEEGLSKQERYEKKYRTEQQAEQETGFSFNKAKRDPVNEVAPPPAEKPTWINPFAK